jgi:hypothetical protein
MTTRRIAPRDGIEVFVNERDTITLSQESQMGEDPATVEVHPEDVEKLVGFLKDAKRELMPQESAHDRNDLAEGLLTDCVDLLDEAASRAFYHGDLLLESKLSRFSQYIAGFLGLEPPITADDPDRDVPSLP